MMQLENKAYWLVGVIHHENLLRQCAQRVPAGCDAVELRLDMTGDCRGDWRMLCKQIEAQGVPVILTIRTANMGGRWCGSEGEREALFRSALSDVSAMDVELHADFVGTLIERARRKQVMVIASFHDMEKTPSAALLQGLVQMAAHMGASLVKIATHVESQQDIRQLEGLLQHAPLPIAVVGLGEKGSFSRVALPLLGSKLAYGSIGKAWLPGQWDIQELGGMLSASRKTRL